MTPPDDHVPKRRNSGSYGDGKRRFDRGRPQGHPGGDRAARGDRSRDFRGDQSRGFRGDQPRGRRPDRDHRERRDEHRGHRERRDEHRGHRDDFRRRRDDHRGRRDRDDRPRERRERDDRPHERRSRTPWSGPPTAPPEPPAPVTPPLDADPATLDRTVRDELRSLPRGVADRVARHLVAAGQLLDDDPEQALAQALAARRLAARAPAVREATGLAAYRAGDWQTALAELRTYQRMSGRHTHLAAVADCERALGRPRRALDLFRTAPQLPTPERVELLIVAAGARLDLAQPEAALTMLNVPERDRSDEVGARLRYAYAEALLAAGRHDEAREWFVRAAQADVETVTDAAERVLELDGVVMASVDDEPDTAAEDAAPDRAAPGDTPPADAAPDSAPLGAALEAAAPPEDTPPAAPRDTAPQPSAARRARLVDGYDLVVLDLDGVVYVGEQAVPGAVEAVTRLRRDGVPVAYATNNASRSREEVAALLQRLGIPAEPAEVVTSAMVAGDTLAAQLAPGSPVLVVGSAALAAEVRNGGLTVVTGADPVPAAVVQGYASDVGWTHLAEASLAVRAGAWWVVTNTDSTLPSPRGPLPGNGALVAAVRAAVGRGPDLVVGKPDPGFFATVAARYGARQPLVVGDRLDTDVAGARAAGMDSLLVLTGVATRDQADRQPPDRRPTHVARDLTALLAPHPPDGSS